MPLIVHPVDLGPLRARLAAVGPAAIRGALQDIGEAARHRWLRLAQGELHTTLGDYVHGLMPAELGDGLSVSVTLVGVLPNLIEQGMDQRDMKETLLGPNVPVVPRGQRGKHRSKAGFYYRTIAFRHQTPGSDEMLAPQMGRPFASRGGPDGLSQLGAAIAGAAVGKAIYREITRSVTVKGERAPKYRSSTTEFMGAPTGAAVL